MTAAALLLCLAALAATAAAAPAGKQYNSRLDSVDVEQILANDRTRTNYLKCFLDKGPCTAEGKEMKKILPEVIATNCAKCSPRLKNNLKKTVITMREKHPNEWKQIAARMDPKGTLKGKLDTFVQQA